MWTKESAEAYVKTLNTPQLTKEIAKRNIDINIPDTNRLCKEITNIYKQAADGCLIKFIPQKRKKRTSKYSQIENKNYQSLKKDLNSLGKLLHKYPNDPILRGQFIRAKKNFSRNL